MKGRPVLVFDGDCGFCRLWIERCRVETGDRVEYAPYQTEAPRHPEVSRENFAQAIHFFELNRISRGAEAAIRALSYAPRLSWLPRVYAIPGFAPIAEAVYRLVAARRPLFSRLTRLLWGETPLPPRTAFTSRLVLAAIGACYLFAFVSLGAQAMGLIGSEGLMPAAPMLESAKTALGSARFWILPSVAWLSASDAALQAYCWLGALAALGMIAGVAAGPCALACWVLYLSLVAVGSDFMSFQWDVLLLEAGLLACFLPAWRAKGGPSRGALWLLRLLLVKLMLQSALVKLFSGDPAWRDLTALTWHYWTQPLPTPLAWWFSGLPLWFHKLSCGIMFAIELGAPFLILMPRRARFAGAGLIAAFMALIAATGNYGFFNLLTIALCLACLDDRVLGRPETGPAPARPAPARSRALAALAAVSLTIGVFETCSILGAPVPYPARALSAAVSPFRSFNRYGLFAVMTKSRDEIVVEVSADGRDWREWPFRHKPGDPLRAPPWVAPHMPRVDWQMWFAALGETNDSPWFANLLFRLLEGSPEVKGLLGQYPLDGGKPLYARAIRYETVFAPAGHGGAWWKRTRKGLFFPVVSLKR